ncbi:MAG: polyribonucleotide nucleotidyltransferase, partial [Oscillospiraceae bacterium]|nr:polyribonucleotide nucleotidyltransferase [Oscillospiraceae bacterium]
MFDKYKVFKTDLAGKPLIIETGKIAQLANGSCFVRYGETVVNVAVTASRKPRDGIDFFPLSVDFEERLYSVGRIPGSYLKREGRPTDKAILSSRVIDRPIRPLFPKNLRNDVSVTCTVMSVDPDCLPEIAAIIGASCAISISDIPWNGPISSVNVGLIDGKFLINPSAEQRENSEMSLTVASTKNLVTMIEASAAEVPNETMFDAIMFGHNANTQIVEFIEDITDKIGKQKSKFQDSSCNADIFQEVKKFAKESIQTAFKQKEKQAREEAIDEVYEETLSKFLKIHPESSEEEIEKCLYSIQKQSVRELILKENKRVDGRTLDELRPLAAEVGILPRAHGSGLFTRGQTQVLTVLTLGPMSDQQMLDGIDGDESKRYIHHYNFPSYSVGETRPSRGPGRREIGHGALAEKALIPVLPSIEEFPYVIRLVSEVVSSNGSTSQGAVCASSLALMDAGVPIKSPVAGISCGLVTDGEKFVTMVDIQGVEDFFGDMDFKVAGTHKGITAIQMDLKIEGITAEIIRDALLKTYKARKLILDNILLETIQHPRRELSKYAPKMLSI